MIVVSSVSRYSFTTWILQALAAGELAPRALPLNEIVLLCCLLLLPDDFLSSESRMRVLSVDSFKAGVVCSEM